MTQQQRQQFMNAIYARARTQLQYVFGMTRTWDKNCGGHLAFFDDKGNITEAPIPSFNTLNIFLVPQMHSVQLVSSFAGASRSRYLGWLQR